jgi:hypothetical protein
MRPLAFIELNELNFDYVRFYAARGRLPCFARLLRDHGVSETSSEERYEHLEPWIQWVTAHTGKSFPEHGVYRLGDIVNHDIPQIWEVIEKQGIKVGAICPMNAKHRLSNPAFFVPDPWTTTEVTARPVLGGLYRALRQAVNDNAHGRLEVRSVLDLLMGYLAYAQPRNYSRFVKLAATALKSPWRKALFMDLLLADVFIAEFARTRPGFATLFLNAAAHIQHHFMFCSAAYEGAQRNPAWYVSPGADPLFEAYELYDRIVANIRQRFPDARIMLATGLHQNPHGQVTFYWRLRNHAEFLRRIGVPFRRVDPRMSRDFLIECGSVAEAMKAQQRLTSAVAEDGTPLFEVDNRGRDLFVMLTYPREIGKDFVFRIGESVYSGLNRDVSFVALKNGEHNGIGYFLDSGAARSALPPRMPLAELPSRVLEALGLSDAEMRSPDRMTMPRRASVS